MTKRYLTQQIKTLHLFNGPEVVRLFLQTELENHEREIFMILFLDNQHRLIKQEEIFLGTINAASGHPREIVKTTLYCNAAALVLAHNHPSGVADPSDSDRTITQKIKQACELIDVRILEHFIIDKGEYFSFAENNWL